MCLYTTVDTFIIKSALKVINAQFADPKPSKFQVKWIRSVAKVFVVVKTPNATYSKSYR